MQKIGIFALAALLCAVFPLESEAAGPEARTLIVFDDGGKPVPGLAKTWQENDDKLVFELRDGVDGR